MHMDLYQEGTPMLLNVKFGGAKPEDKTPNVAVYLLDPSGQVQRKVAVAKEGKLQVDPGLAREGRGVIALGPDVEDLRKIPRESLLQLRLSDHLPEWEKTKSIEIARDWWTRWHLFEVCLSGRVRKCFPILFERVDAVFLKRFPVPKFPFPPPKICFPICNGVVEVYERVCCCRPPIIIDIPSIIARLRQELRVPPIPFPPPPPPPPERIGAGEPGPDPVPDRVALASLKKSEAFGEKPMLARPTTQLHRDLRALEALAPREALQYFNERAYLWPFWCTCSSRSLGEAVLGPDGTFNFCFSRWPFIILRNCRFTYFYKVKQWQDTQWVYIYDGSLSHEYFNADDFAELDTFFGRACGGDPPPVTQDKPFVMLQDIGATHSYNLVSHYLGKNLAGVDLTQTGEFSVATPVPDGGLVNPPYDAPWGEVISFRLYFHPGMEGLGAVYYRMSSVAADNNGNPVGGATPQPITNGVSWLKFVFAGRQVQVAAESLGPQAVGGTAGLFKIPYDADALWLGGQFHQSLDTRLYPNGRYLIILEVFDSTGARLKPTGSPGAGTDKDFSYLRWLVETGPDSIATVPFAALTHLFWFDNRPCYGDIEDLKKNHVANTAECQFLSGPSTTLFSVGFRAFHAATGDPVPPPQTFMDSFYLSYLRGLNGPTMTFESGNTNQPPWLLADGNAESTALTFASMLCAPPALLNCGDPGSKCSFAVKLAVYCKHTNGSGRLSEYDRHDEAAFALEIT